MKTITSGRVALVLAGLALVVALGGTAYAVNTVRSRDIVDNTIKTQDIGNGQVTTADIRNGNVGTADIAAASLGRAPAIWARVAGFDGAKLLERGGLGTSTRHSTGRYTIQAGRDIQACTYQVTPRTSDVTAGADQASTTAVNVYLDDPSSGPIDTDFDIVFFC